MVNGEWGSGREYRSNVFRVVAAAVSVVAGLGFALCFTHWPSVMVDGEVQRCRGDHLFYEMASELGEGNHGSWRPGGCAAEYHRRMTYAGGLGLLSVAAGTGAAFHRREDEVAEEPVRG